MEEYNSSTVFPVTISVSPRKHTFAVFGKNETNGIEAEPVASLSGNGHVACMPPSSGS